MKTSRSRVLEFIHSHKIATIGEISSGLTMTPANARHHIHILLSQNLVEIAGKRPVEGKGRPTLLYGVSKMATGNNLKGLADALLNEIKESDLSSANDKLLQNIAKRIAAPGESEAKFGHILPETSTVTTKLLKVIKLLNERHYDARWEARKDSPHIVFGNCPYEVVLDRHPELCTIDRFLLEEILDLPAKQLEKRKKDSRGVPFCLFQIILRSG